MYFPDEKYEEYLKTMQELFSDKDKFIQAEREIIFSQPDLLKKYFISDELQKYIQDKNFKKELDASVKNSVITPEHFENNLAKIIIKNESDYLCTFPIIFN